LNNDFVQYHLYRGSTVNTVNDSDAVSDWAEVVYDESIDNLINYYVDMTVDENHRYYYRLTCEDDIANISSYSSIDSTIPDGSGGSGITSTPSITNLSVADKGTTWVKLTWNTSSVASDSKVYYSTGIINEGTSPSVTVATMGEYHEVVITGLDVGAEYNFRAKSSNLDGNSDTDDVIESTNSGAQISSVIIPEIYNTQVVVRWAVSENPTAAKIYYTSQISGDVPDFSSSDNQSAECDGDTLICRVDISGLSVNTKYYFYVEADNDTDKNPERGVIRYFNFRTDNDQAAPIIIPNDAVFGAPIIKTDTKAVIKWITDKKAVSRVLHKESGDSYNDPSWSQTYTMERAVVLDNLSRNTTYIYKIQTIDINGNQSESDEFTFSTLAKQEDHPDLIAPDNPTNANVLMTSETEAVIYFSGNTQTTAKLCYETSQISDVDTCDNYKDDDTASITHVFYLENLQSNQVYYYRIKLIDSVNNDIYFYTADSSMIKFTTESLADSFAPGLSTYSVSDTSSDSAEISVVSDSDSIVSIYYSDSTDDFISDDYEEKSSSKSFTTTHSINLKNLSQGRTYYFKIKLQDENGNYNLYDNGGVYYTFETVSGPNISDGPDCSSGNNQLTISWDTDEDADAYVIYSEDDDLADYFKKGEDEKKEDHSITIGSLLPQVKYYYQIISENVEGGVSASDIEECSTLGEGVDSQAPDISSIQAVLIGKNQALINWTTNEVSTSKVRYGKTENYSSTMTENTDMVTNHNVLLEDLDSGTTYHYQVVSKDASANSDESGDYTFKTLGAATEDTDLAGFITGAYTAPDISSASASVSKTLSNSVTVSWKTDKEATSVVVYKPEGGNYKDQGDTTTLTTNHEITINDLSPNTKYTFYVKSVDSLGNTGQSDTDTFTTSAVSDIFNVEVIDVSYDSATISWETSANTTSQLEYGKSREMDKEITKDGDRSKAHAINLTSLDAGTKYYFRIKGEDSSSNIYSSSEYAFSTPAPPEVQDFKVDSIDEHNIKVSFRTSIETDAFITLTNSEKEDEQHFQGSPEQKTEHSLEVGNLDSGATYKLSVKVRDKEGNTTEKEIDKYTTAKDENPPVISNLRTTSALTQNGKVQTILSWDTDEPAKTMFIYRQGIGGNKKEVVVDENYTVKHTAIITTLEQGTAYYFNAKAVDKSGNTKLEQDRGVLTPKDRKNIIQVITNNFQNIFSWTSNIGM
ncbi:MAG: Cytochrome C family protein, partial [Candidatus Moranbacteria bacterium GW2011_GWF1_36_4]